MNHPRDKLVYRVIKVEMVVARAPDKIVFRKNPAKIFNTIPTKI